MSNTIHVSSSTPALELLVASGVTANRDATPVHLELYAKQANQVFETVRQMMQSGKLSHAAAVEFQQLLVDAAARVLCHPIIAGNKYLERFARGVTVAQARHEIQQFSVFGLQFDVAQAKLVANARTPEAYYERLKVLLNEKGIPYKDGFEGELTGKWSLPTVHFTWMQTTAAGLGLKFEDLGKIWIAYPGPGSSSMRRSTPMPVSTRTPPWVRRLRSKTGPLMRFGNPGSRV